jgi:hypothetical protein
MLNVQQSQTSWANAGAHAIIGMFDGILNVAPPSLLCTVCVAYSIPTPISR